MEIPPRATLMKPWLPEAGAVMIYAPRGIGKTYMALSIACAVATATPLMRWRVATPRRVLCIDGEMPMVALQERVASIVRGLPANPPEDDFLRFLPADHFRDGLPDIAGPEGRKLLERVTVGVDLLIIDNLSSLARGRENEADDWQGMQDLILALRRRGVSTLLVHHAAKGGQQRGTSRREDVLDTVIALRRPDGYSPAEGARFEVHFEKARGFMGADAAPFEARLEMAADGCRWHVSDLAGDDKAEARRRLAAGEKPEEIAKSLGVSRASVYRWKAEAAGG